MRRWHKDGCQSPEIVLVDSNSTLHCKSCSAHSSLDETTDAAQKDNRSPPPRTENQPLKWPAKARYLGEFSSAVEVTQPPRKISRVGSTATQNEEVARPETLFDDEIRLIRLMPCEDSNGPVHLMWEKTHLRERPVQTYDAVSYTTAGGPSRWKPVFIGVFWDIIYIHTNCEAALRHIRYLDLTQLLWVDELCIDLDDVLERNHQVGLSREIYVNAKAVLTFLGDYSPETKLILESFKKAKAGGLAEIFFTEFRDAWRCFSDLPIFSRVWILQEMLVSRHLVLISGDSVIPWPKRTKITVVPKPINNSIVHRMIENESLNEEFLDILLAASQYECSDARDKVFGVLGLVDEAIRPDYSLSVEDVYTGVAAYLATYLRDMRILNFAGSARSNLDIPSWVPDWTQKQALQFPSHEHASTDLGMDGMVTFSFHGMVPNNIEILVDPKSRALQCSGIRLCSHNGRWQLSSILAERGHRRAVFPRDNQGNVVTNYHSTRELFGFTTTPRPLFQEGVSVFLLQGMEHPVLLRYLPEKEAYSLLSTCVVSFRQPRSQAEYFPWEVDSSDSSTQPFSNLLNVYRITTEDMDRIVEFDSRVLDVIWRRQNITPDPDHRTFFHSMTRFMDLVEIFFLEIHRIEKTLRDCWKDYESRLGLMFQDPGKVWSFVEHLGEQDDEIRGTEKMPRADKLNTAWKDFPKGKLPYEYTWDLERFCLSFVSGSSAPPPPVDSLEDDDVEPEDLISNMGDIRAWAETTEKLLRIMSFTEKHMSSSWPSFPGNDMARTWLAPFETGVWKWEKFRASLVARESIWEILIPEELDPRVNHNIKMRFIMNQLGLVEEEMQVTII